MNCNYFEIASPKRAVRHAGKRRLGKVLVCAALQASFLSLASVRANENYYDASINSVNVSYVPSEGFPVEIEFLIDATFARSSHTLTCNPTEGTKVMVTLFNTSNDSVECGTSQEYYPAGSGINTVVTITCPYDLAFGPSTFLVDKFRVNFLDSNCLVTSSNPTNDGNPQALDTPNLTCLDPSDIERYFSMGFGTMTSVDFDFHKSIPALYTLPKNDKSGAQSGEAINGEFKAPNDGHFTITVTGDTASADVFASTGPDLPGWVVPGARQGAKVTGSKCYSLVAGERVMFNLVGRKQDAESTLKLVFDFYWWNTQSSGIDLARRELDVQVRPLAGHEDNSEPLLARYQAWTKSDGTVDAQLQLPKCCSGGGNLSYPIIAWPTPVGERITNGHARGWTIQVDGIVTPTPGRVKYKFAP